jgi:hypothetical protein
MQNYITRIHGALEAFDAAARDLADATATAAAPPVMAKARETAAQLLEATARCRVLARHPASRACPVRVAVVSRVVGTARPEAQ